MESRVYLIDSPLNYKYNLSKSYNVTLMNFSFDSDILGGLNAVTSVHVAETKIQTNNDNLLY